jgi:hypothetical protein
MSSDDTHEQDDIEISSWGNVVSPDLDGVHREVDNFRLGDEEEEVDETDPSDPEPESACGGYSCATPEAMTSSNTDIEWSDLASHSASPTAGALPSRDELSGSQQPSEHLEVTSICTGTAFDKPGSQRTQPILGQGLSQRRPLHTSRVSTMPASDMAADSAPISASLQDTAAPTPFLPNPWTTVDPGPSSRSETLGDPRQKSIHDTGRRKAPRCRRICGTMLTEYPEPARSRRSG